MVLIISRLSKSWQQRATLRLLLRFLLAPGEAEDLSTTRILITVSARYPMITIMVEMTIQNLTMSLLGDLPGQQWASSLRKITSHQHLENESLQLNYVDFGAIPTSWWVGGLECLSGGAWTQACTARIEEGICSSIWMIKSPCWCIYFLEEEFKWSRWAIGGIEKWKFVVIWALFWWLDRPHRRRRIQCPDISLNLSGHGHGTCEANSCHLCNDYESLCHECSEDHPDSKLVVWGNHQD